MSEKIVKTDEQWREELSPEQYRVLRQAGTERPWTGEYTDFRGAGEYVCAGCGAKLFESGTKFDSHCGWPSFYDAIPGTVEMRDDHTHGMHRIEVVCTVSRDGCQWAFVPRTERRAA